MKSVTSVVSILLAMVGLAGAPALAATRSPAAPAGPSYGPEADYPVTIGESYAIGGVTYTPADTLNYDAVGYAHAGTDGSGISGAHHTLPLPCYVEVTSLDSGRTILVRLDRRGPMNGKQLIELSPAAWAQLGLPAGADAAVRVRRVNPPEPDRALLRVGNRAAERMETPPGLRTALRRRLGVATPSTPDEPPSATLSGGGVRSAALPGPALAKSAAPMPAPAPMPSAPRAVAPKPAPPVPTPAKPVPPKPTPPASTPPKAVAKPTAPTPTTAKPEAAKPVAAKPVLPKPVPPKPAEPVAKTPAHPASGHFVVQVAAFGSREHAEKCAGQVGGKVEAAGKLWRVRIGAESDAQARAALAKAKQSGYAGAMILHHD